MCIRDSRYLLHLLRERRIRQSGYRLCKRRMPEFLCRLQLVRPLFVNVRQIVPQIGKFISAVRIVSQIAESLAQAAFLLRLLFHLFRFNLIYFRIDPIHIFSFPVFFGDKLPQVPRQRRQTDGDKLL